MKMQIAAVAGIAALLLLASLHAPPRSPAPSFAQTPAAPRALWHKPARSVLATQVVYVAGAVARRGLYRLAADARADDAVRAAGGFTKAADPDGVNLAAPLQDGDEVLVPERGATVRKGQRRARSTSRRKKSRRPASVLDLNTAGAGALATLPGVGEGLAERIVRFREVNGPFSSVDELADVAGMTQRRVDALAAYLEVHEAP